MNMNAVALALLKIAVPLGTLLALLGWLFDKAELSFGMLATHIVISLVYAWWMLHREGWLNSLREDNAAGLKALIAAGKPRFLLRHGALGQGLALAYLITAAEWAATGVMPGVGSLLADLVAMGLLGALFAHYDWQKLEREVA